MKERTPKEILATGSGLVAAAGIIFTSGCARIPEVPTHSSKGLHSITTLNSENIIPNAPQENIEASVELGTKALQLARQQIGKEYGWGEPYGEDGREWWRWKPGKKTAPEKFDCSGLTGWAWYWISEKETDMRGQTRFDWENATPGKYRKLGRNARFQPGDMLYFRNRKEGIHHTVLFVEETPKGIKVIQAPYTGGKVKEGPLSSNLEEELIGALRPRVSTNLQ